LVLEPPERARVDDPVAVALEHHPERVLRLGMTPAARSAARHGIRREAGGFPILQRLPAHRHPTASVSSSAPAPAPCRSGRRSPAPSPGPLPPSGPPPDTSPAALWARRGGSGAGRPSRPSP